MLPAEGLLCFHLSTDICHMRMARTSCHRVVLPQVVSHMWNPISHTSYKPPLLLQVFLPPALLDRFFIPTFNSMPHMAGLA